MKTRKLTLAFATLLLASAAFVSACKKKDKTTTDTKDTDTAAASDNSLAETTSNDVVSMSGQASENGALSSYRFGGPQDVTGLSCATVSVTGTKIFTVTFSGGICMDGRTRSGSLTFDYSASTNGANFYRNPGFSCHITSNNYVVDSYSVTINKTVTNTTAVGFNPTTTNLKWSISGSVTIVKPSGGGTITWNCTRIKELLNTSGDTTLNTSCYHGQLTPIDWSKARIGITGNTSGTTATGVNFSANTTSQLVRDMTCTPLPSRPGYHPFIQGALDFTPGTKHTRHIDYGSGTCDLAYTVTIDGVSYNLTLN